MGTYNRNFELGVDDLDLIECALRRAKKDLSLRRLEILASKKGDDDRAGELDEIQSQLSETSDLLGRLHNQKVFFRPREDDAPYIGG